MKNKHRDNRVKDNFKHINNIYTIKQSDAYEQYS